MLGQSLGRHCPCIPLYYLKSLLQSIVILGEGIFVPLVSTNWWDVILEVRKSLWFGKALEYLPDVCALESWCQCDGLEGLVIKEVESSGSWFTHWSHPHWKRVVWFSQNLTYLQIWASLSTFLPHCRSVLSHQQVPLLWCFWLFGMVVESPQKLNLWDLTLVFRNQHFFLKHYPASGRLW